mmetsp:Transcript_107333/g.308894  ORF Transcript_107333/g.308894 Transcript_107333/m.308894 type:complete len:129 (-) Transcript_107333:251-637(-)
MCRGPSLSTIYEAAATWEDPSARKKKSLLAAAVEDEAGARRRLMEAAQTAMDAIAGGALETGPYDACASRRDGELSQAGCPELDAWMRAASSGTPSARSSASSTDLLGSGGARRPFGDRLSARRLMSL